jgi:K+-sensing histidine kinase KdpD
MDNLRKQQSQHSDLRPLAHDLLNIMTVMYCYMQVLELSLTNLKLEKEKKIAENIIKEMQKINSLISEQMGVLENRADLP